MSALASADRRPSKPRAGREVCLPSISAPLRKFFILYAKRHLARHFHAIRVLRRGQAPGAHGEQVVFCNHPSWWDPLVLLFLSERYFKGRDCFGPIDAASLAKYRIFRRLGFFPVEPATRAGAVEFLSVAGALLEKSSNMLWVTPQGDFVDARARPTTLRRGVGHLATRLPQTSFLPLAVEYCFWNERLPEILLHFGPPVMADPHSHPDALTARFENALEKLQDELAEAALRRDPDEWETILRGQAGSSRIYDFWRRLRARLTGHKFSAAHSDE